MEIRDARSLPSVAQEDLRHKAVKCVMDGRKQVEVAEVLGVTRHAVGKWVKMFRLKGEEALEAKRRGRPKGGLLLSWQAAQIAKTVVDHNPEQLRLPFYLWTREAVAQLIEQRFGIRLSVWTVGRYLSRWGFTPQKPARRAYEQNPEAIRCWLEEDYPAIQRQAKKEKALIFWGDETGLRSDHVAGRSYGRCGQTPVIPGTGKRFGCNMISAITNQGKLNFMVFKDSFNTEVFLEFLRRLLRQIQRKIFLIVDSHPVHRGIKVRKWVEKHRRQIRLSYLPGYSPELNPDELLNQDIKSNAVGRRRAKNQEELVANARSFLQSHQKQPHIIRQYFQGEHVRYAAM
jgi:transposase